MLSSSLSPVGSIAERSEATPGLFNNIFSTLSRNIDAVNAAGSPSFNTITPVSGNTVSLQSHLTVGGYISAQGLGIGAVPPSAVTTHGITVAVNSGQSDYLYLVDSSGARSNYVIGSRAGGTADGLNIWDASGATMIATFSKQSVRFFQNVVGPVFDTGGALADTLNAATFGTGADSDESRIQAAINQAATDGISRVYLPANMYPYSASSVSFIASVQLVREGGNWAVNDVLAYGARNDGTGNDSSAFVAATAGLNAAGGTVYIPAGTYTLYSTLTLTGQEGSTFLGAGGGATTIRSYVSNAAPAINFSVSITSGRNQILRGFKLRRIDYAATLPSVVTGNYGVAAIGGIGISAILDDVQVEGFGDSGFYIAGPTAPVSFRHCNALFCGRYAASFVAFGGSGPGNVTIYGGAYQHCRGGIYFDGVNAQAFSLIAADVELGVEAVFPALYVSQMPAGLLVAGGSYSAGVTGSSFTLIPNGVICLENSRNAVVSAVQCLANSGADNVLIDGGSNHVFLGGEYANRSTLTTGFLISISGAILNHFIAPFATGFATGKSVVSDANFAANRNFVYGLRTNSDDTEATYFGTSARGPTGSATLPSWAFTSEASLGWYRSAGSTMALSYGGVVVPGVLKTTGDAGQGGTGSFAALTYDPAAGHTLFLIQGKDATTRGSFELRTRESDGGNGLSIITVDTNGVLGLETKTRFSAGTITLAEAPAGGGLVGDAAGDAGDIAWGSSSGVSYLYVCVSASSWMRATLNPF